MDQGTGKAIRFLQFGNGNTICLTQTVERIAWLDDIGDPTLRWTTPDWCARRNRWKVNHLTGYQIIDPQTISRTDLCTRHSILQCQFIKTISTTNHVQQPTLRSWATGQCCCCCGSLGENKWCGGLSNEKRGGAF